MMTFLTSFTRTILATLTLFTLFGAGYSVCAQENTASVDVVVLAQVSVSDASVVQSDTTLTATFTLTNSAETLQSDIRYGMELWSVSANQSEPSVRVHVAVADETFALPAQASLQKTLSAAVPSTLSGLYRVRIVAETTSGLPLGSTTAGTVRLSGEGIVIDQSTCEVLIEGESTVYTTSQGVDMTEEETLLLSCAVSNPEDATTLTPYFTTTLRSLYGEEVERKMGESMTIPAGESVLTFTIPTPSAPQAYDTAVTLLNGTTPFSNTAYLHYVIQGASATVQHIMLDKATYQEGDTATATLFLTGIAGSFPNARTESETLSNPALIATLHSQSDVACAEPVVTSLADLEDTGVAFADITFSVTRTCPNATVSIEVKDDSGVLATHTAVTNTPDPATLSFAALIVLILIAGVIVYLVSRAGRSVPAAVILVAFAVSSVFVGNVGAQEMLPAPSLTITSGIVTTNISLDKGSYIPGEPVAISTTGAHFSTCLNLSTNDFAAFSWAIDNPTADFPNNDSLFTRLLKFFGLADWIDVEGGSGMSSQDREYFYYINTLDLVPFMNQFATLEEAESVSEDINNFIAQYVSGDVPYKTSYYTGTKMAPFESGMHTADVFIEKLRNPFLIDLATGDSFITVAQAIITNDFNEEHIAIPFEVTSTNASAITLTATPDIVYEGDNTTLSWVPLNTVSCVASSEPAISAWEGSVTADAPGSKVVGPLTESIYVFALSCLGISGEVIEDSVTVYTEPVIYPECSDNADNDGDGWVDEEDPGCFTGGVYDPNDDDESDTAGDCSDGVDNDGDGQVDGADPGCAGSGDPNETGEPTEPNDTDLGDNDNDDSDPNDNGDPNTGDGGTTDPSDDDPDEIDFSEF
ncbi:MAG: hypothetical protein H8D63_00745 [Parcubacteria group bacterium]|nr:hypothetical protein [Parcubacteria group bacterium]